MLSVVSVYEICNDLLHSIHFILCGIITLIDTSSLIVATCHGDRLQSDYMDDITYCYILNHLLTFCPLPWTVWGFVLLLGLETVGSLHVPLEKILSYEGRRGVRTKVT